VEFKKIEDDNIHYQISNKISYLIPFTKKLPKDTCFLGNEMTSTNGKLYTFRSGMKEWLFAVSSYNNRF
jgi:hypothetical protein